MRPHQPAAAGSRRAARGRPPSAGGSDAMTVLSVVLTTPSHDAGTARSAPRPRAGGSRNVTPEPAGALEIVILVSSPECRPMPAGVATRGGAARVSGARAARDTPIRACEPQRARPWRRVGSTMEGDWLANGPFCTAAVLRASRVGAAVRRGAEPATRYPTALPRGGAWLPLSPLHRTLPRAWILGERRAVIAWLCSTWESRRRPHVPSRFSPQTPGKSNRFEVSQICSGSALKFEVRLAWCATLPHPASPLPAPVQNGACHLLQNSTSAVARADVLLQHSARQGFPALVLQRSRGVPRRPPQR